MSEKLRTQQMNNDLEKLTHELEKIGLNKERLLHDESSDDRYQHTNKTGNICCSVKAFRIINIKKMYQRIQINQVGARVLIIQSFWLSLQCL